MGVPPNWMGFRMVNPSKMDDLGGTTILGNHQLLLFFPKESYRMEHVPNYAEKIEKQNMLDNIIPRKDK